MTSLQSECATKAKSVRAKYDKMMELINEQISFKRLVKRNRLMRNQNINLNTKSQIKCKLPFVIVKGRALQQKLEDQRLKVSSLWPIECIGSRVAI